MLCFPGVPEAQGFTIVVAVPQGVTGMARATLYHTDAQPQVMKQRIKNGTITFSGNVRQPTVTSLVIGDNAPLFLWVDNADIAIDYNPALPAASRITGSRSNSEYRYALEMCAQEATARGGNGGCGTALLEYASQHLTCRYIPFLLWLYYLDDDYVALDSLCRHMAGDAAEAYHYPLLRRKANAIRNSAAGCHMPGVTIPLGRTYTPGDSNAATQPNTKHPYKRGNMVPLDSLIHGTTAFLLVSPSWLEQEAHLFDSLCAAVQHSKITARVVWAAADNAPQGWDETYMQLLNIQRMPYIILIDSQGKIAARDVRVWEAGRLLSALPPQEDQATQHAKTDAKPQGTKKNRTTISK